MLAYVVTDKRKVEISQNVEAFSEYKDFTASSTFFFKSWINLTLITNYYSTAAQNGAKPCKVV